MQKFFTWGPLFGVHWILGGWEQRWISVWIMRDFSVGKRIHKSPRAPIFFREGCTKFDIFLQRLQRILIHTNTLNPYLGTNNNSETRHFRNRTSPAGFCGPLLNVPKCVPDLTPLRLNRNSGRWIQWAMMYSADCFARWKRTVAGPTMVPVHHPCCVKWLVVALLSIHVVPNFNFCGVKHLPESSNLSFPLSVTSGGNRTKSKYKPGLVPPKQSSASPPPMFRGSTVQPTKTSRIYHFFHAYSFPIFQIVPQVFLGLWVDSGLCRAETAAQ